MADIFLSLLSTCIILLIIGMAIGGGPVFSWLIWKKDPAGARAFLGIFVIPWLGLVLITFIFGPLSSSIALTCLSTLIMFLVILISPEITKSRRRYKRLYLGGILLIAVTQFSPLLINLPLANYCEQQTDVIGEQIAAGVVKYRDINGRYPDTWPEIIPDYLAAEPHHPCSMPVIRSRAIVLKQCNNPETFILTTRSFYSSIHVYRYSFNTGKWSYIDVLDGDCSFLD